MADEKKGFLLYADYQGLVNQLPDETAGQLFKLILSYVNDENPEPTDLTLRIAFEPIKRQLKRDLKSYQKVKKRRSEGGKKGMETRWKKDITQHNSVMGVISELSPVITQHNSTDSVITHITDNVNGNDNVNVNDNVIKSKSFALSFPHTSEEFLKLWGDWVEHRAAIKKPYSTFSSQQIELQELGGHSEPVAIQMLKNALKGGWRNIRPLDLLPTVGGHTRAKRAGT